MSRCTQRKQCQRRHDESCLREKQHISFSITVRDHACKRAADQDGQELRREHESDEKAAVRELQRKPRKRHSLHPRADRRNDLAGEKEPVIAMTKRAEHA